MAVAAGEQTVIVYLKGTNLIKGSSLDDLSALERRLEGAIDRAGVGEYDGNEVRWTGAGCGGSRRIASTKDPRHGPQTAARSRSRASATETPRSM